MKYCKALLVLALLFMIKNGSAQKVFYISTTGNDSGNGSLQHPFRTIEKAKLLLRQQKGKVTVYLRGGDYFFKKPLVFDASDSRKPNEQVVYKAYGDEKVVFSSAPVQYLLWRPYKNNILVAAIDTSLNWDQLFVNGQLQRMARYPNYQPGARIYGGTDSSATSKERIAGWQNPAGGYLHAMHKSEWGDFHFLIKGKNKDGQLELEGGWQNNRQNGLHTSQRFVENIFEELDAENEWFADKTSGLLYYFPPKQFSPSTAAIQSPQLKHLVEFRGTGSNPVQNISLQGIEFTHTLRTFMQTNDPLLRSDWTIYRGGAILFEGAINCSISQCSFIGLGGNAVFLNGFNQKDSVSSSIFFQIGASAICFVGDTSAVRNPLHEYKQSLPLSAIDRTAGPKNNSFPSGCVAYDNLIHDIGTIEKQVAGVQISMSQDITVSHNTIYQTPRAGININDGTWGGHVIEFNDVFNTVMETGDHGAFNSWGRDRFWHPIRDSMNRITKTGRDEFVLLDAVKTNILRNNRFRCDHGWDIDLDDGSSNYQIYNNLLLNGGLKLREGFFRVAENNMIINNSFHPHVWFTNSEDVFRKNIITTGYYPIRITQWGKEVDYNIFLDSAGLQTAQQQGHDQHSIFTKTSLEKTNDGSYILKQEQLPGMFQPFDQTQFGVISTKLKALAKQSELPVVLNNMQSTDTTVFEVFGLTIKNVFAGERSATGMDSERGVYVSGINASSPFASVLRANDVLLLMNDQPLHNAKDLALLKNSLRFNKPFKIIIFRDQRSQEIVYAPR
jgi:hypothetical protein